MCTLTYVPLDNGYVWTSNRDEMADRPTIVPRVYDRHGQRLIFPKDGRSGGSWIAVSERGGMRFILNGAFEQYFPHKSYPKSRGVVLLESFDGDDIEAFWSALDLSQVESFTLVAMDNDADRTLYEMIWDEKQKYLTTKNPQDHHIWSSATLYSREVRADRKGWFEHWQAHRGFHSREDILDFHKHPHSPDSAANLIMKRDNGVRTLSISQIAVLDQKPVFDHHDLLNDNVTTLRF